MNSSERLHRLIAQYQTGQISDEEFAELEVALRESQDARALFHRVCRIDSQLRREAEQVDDKEQGDAEIPAKVISPIFRPMAWFSAAAAVAMAAILTWSQASQPRIIATLVSAEDAAWESSLPTEPGSRLTRGYLKLQSGIATIRFESGAELVLEAPAKLMLKGVKRAKLVGGVALLDVPDSAIGFVLETPDGHAVDYGTKFSVDVDGAGRQSKFEVIKGEIGVHHAGSGQEVRLVGAGRSATLSPEVLVAFDSIEQEEEVPRTQEVLRVGTEGRTTSVIPNNKREKFLRPDVLSVKTTNSGKWDQRSLMSFDVSAVNLREVESVRLRLNLVPSSAGYASRLPKINRFSVYGLVNPAKSDWKIDCLWEEAPGPEDGTLLGSFEIPRSQERGAFTLQTAALLKFLKANAARPVTLILVRETTQIEGKGPGMTHMFAADSHAEAVGPSLEFVSPKP